jgi:hypothetical protein
MRDGSRGRTRRIGFQPEWSPDGDLYFVSDRGSGWWNLYRERDGAIESIAPMDAEFGRPQWQFGISTYAFELADRLISCFVRDGISGRWRRLPYVDQPLELVLAIGNPQQPSLLYPRSGWAVQLPRPAHSRFKVNACRVNFFAGAVEKRSG